MTSTKAKSKKDSKSSAKSKNNLTSPKSKKTSLKKEPLIAPDAWINELANLNINDENWKCFVAILEAQTPDTTVYIEHYNESAINGSRLAIKSISKLDIMRVVVKNMVQSNSNKNLTPLSLLSTVIFELIGTDFDKTIPTDLLAPLIKYIILEYKMVNKKVREGIHKLEKEMDEYHQSFFQSSKSVKSDKSVSNLQSENGQKKSRPKGQLKEKAFTKLRKRGEEWKDVVWVDDAPLDGPQLYVTISNFFDDRLPLELLNIDVPLKAIINLDIGYEFPIKSESSLPPELKNTLTSLNEFARWSLPHLSSFSKITNINNTKDNATIIRQFWEKIDTLKSSCITFKTFENTMFLTIVPEHCNFEYAIKPFQKEIYNQISFFLYDAFETQKLHEEYLQEMKVLSVSDDKICDHNMKPYTSLLDSIPHEVLTVPFLLDCIITQVCCVETVLSKQDVEEQVIETFSDISLRRDESEPLVKLLKELNVEYDIFNEPINTITEGSSGCVDDIQQQKLTVLTYFDDISKKTIHLVKDVKELVNKRTNYILRTGWERILSGYFKSLKIEENLTRLCQEMIADCLDTSQNALYYYMCILIINSILDSFLLLNYKYNIEENTLRESKGENFSKLQTVLTEDNQNTYNKNDLCDDCWKEINENKFSNQKLLSETKSNNKNSKEDLCDECWHKLETLSLTNNLEKDLIGLITQTQSNYFAQSCTSYESITSCRSIDELISKDLYFIEEMEPEVLLQRIQTVSSEFSHIETRFCTFSDQVIVVFHNLDNSLHIEENWLGKLTTPVPLRDFVDYIMKEEINWIKRRPLQSSNRLHSLKHSGSLFSCNVATVSDLFTETLFISHRSLKYETMMKHQQLVKAPKKSPKLKSDVQSDVTRASLPKKNKTKKKSSQKSISSKIKESSPRKRTKKDDAINQKLAEPKDTVKPVETLEEPVDKNMMFTGYDLGEAKRVQFSGCKKVKILDRNCKLTVEAIKKLYGDETHLLKVDACGHCLYYSFNANSETLSETPFHIILSTGILLHFELNFVNRFKTNNLFIQPIKYPTNFQFRNNSEVNSKETDRSQNNLKLFDLSWMNKLHGSHSFLYVIREPNYHEIPSSYTMNISTPSGLHIEFVQTEDSFFVRQTLFSKGPKCQSVTQEKYRCCLSSGEIVKFMMNGNVEVYLANGSLYSIFNIGERSDRQLHEEETNSIETKQVFSEANKKENQKLSGKDKTGVSKRKKSSVISKSGKSSTDINSGVNTSPSDITLKDFKTKTGHYQLSTSDGRRYMVENNVTETLHSLFMSPAVDIENNNIITERSDGVITTHLADGSLKVHFPDDSIIISTPIETDEIFCHWSQEERLTWFESSNDTFTDDSRQDSRRKGTDSTIIDSSRKSESFVRYDCGDLCSECKVELELSCSGKFTVHPKLNFANDGFVVFNMSYCIEHPNYGTIFYDASKCEVGLTLPHCTSIILRSDGSYNASFDQGQLVVESDEIYFNKVSADDNVQRTTVINNSRASRKLGNMKDNLVRIRNTVRDRQFIKSVRNFSFLSSTAEGSSDSVIYNPFYAGILLYSVDELGNETYIDNNLNICDITSNNASYEIKASDFMSFVIDQNLRGFRFVSNNEVVQHLKDVEKGNGLTIEADDVWGTIFTSSPMTLNESEKWLMDTKIKPTISHKETLNYPTTYGKRSSWLQPFVDQDNKNEMLDFSDVMVVRLLYKIPKDQNTKNSLKKALEQFKKWNFKRKSVKTVTYKKIKGDINLDDILQDSDKLVEIYKNEKMKLSKEKDYFRKDMKRKFINALVRKACIVTTKRRQAKKEEELKTSLRNKYVPPYHLSCYGMVHSILDDVFLDVNKLHKKTSSTSTYINNMIGEVLSLACRSKSEISRESLTETNEDGDGLVDKIFAKFCDLINDRSHEKLIHVILEKPLIKITLDDILFLREVCESSQRHQLCPLLFSEDFILQDILDAALQLSHYFSNLREVLACYRK